MEDASGVKTHQIDKTFNSPRRKRNKTDDDLSSSEELEPPPNYGNKSSSSSSDESMGSSVSSSSTSKSKRLSKLAQDRKNRLKMSEEIHFPKIREYFEANGYSSNNIESLKDKFGGWSKDFSTLYLEKLQAGGEMCVPMKPTTKQITPLKHLFKVLLVPEQEFDPDEDLRLWDFKRLPNCTDDTCYNFKHWYATRKVAKILRGGKRSAPHKNAVLQPKGAANITDEAADHLVRFFQQDFDNIIASATRKDALILAKSFMAKTELSASDIVSKMRSKECQQIGVKGSHDSLFSLMQRVIWFMHNSGVNFEKYGSISLCEQNTNTKLCLSHSHQHPLPRTGVIYIVPKPIRPPDDKILDSERPFPIESEKEIPENDEDFVDNEIPKNDDEDYSDDAEEVISEETVMKYKEVIQKRIEELENEVELEEEIGKEMTEEDVDKWLAFFLELADVPNDLKEDKDQLRSLIRHALMGGASYQERVIISTEKREEIWGKVEQFIATKFVKGTGFHYTKSIKRIKLVNALLFEICEMKNLVKSFEKEIKDDQDDVREAAIDEQEHENLITERLQSACLLFANKTISVITKKGFSSAWGLAISENTIVSSSKAFREFVCYMIAKNPKEMDQRFANYDFLKNEFVMFEQHLADSRQRHGSYMNAIMDFLRGARTAVSEYQEDEYLTLKASTIVNYRVGVGTFLKFFGYLKMERGQFNTSRGEMIKLLENLTSQTVSTDREKWPIMKEDILEYFKHVPVKTVYQLQERVLLLFMVKSGWRPSSFIQMRSHKRSTSTPGLRLKNLKFYWTGDRVSVEFTGIYTKMGKKALGGQEITSNAITDGTSNCLVKYLILLLSLRGAFTTSIVDGFAAKRLTIKQEFLENFVFLEPRKCQNKHYNFLLENVSLSYSHLKDTTMKNIASALKIPLSLVSPKCLRKGAAVEIAFQLMNDKKGVVTMEQILELLRSDYNWKSDASKSYLYFGADELRKTIDRFRDICKIDTSVKPEHVHRYVKDLFTNKFFVGVDHNLVSFTIDLLKPYWRQIHVNMTPANEKKFIARRRQMLASYFSCFSLHVGNQNIPTLAVENFEKKEIDFELMEQFYCWPFPGSLVQDLLTKCPFAECNVTTILHYDLKCHLKKAHIDADIPCRKCSKSFKYNHWVQHIRAEEMIIFNCRYCHTFLSHTAAYLCFKNEHNVVPADRIELHWKDTPVASVSSLAISEVTVTKESLLQRLDKFKDKDIQFRAGIIQACMMDNNFPYIRDVEFEQYLPHLNL